MATDALQGLQATVTKTSTFQGAAMDLITRPSVTLHLWARVLYSAASNASGSNTVTFTVEGSVDNVNWGTIGGARVTDAVTLSTTPQAGELWIPVSGFQLLRYVRLVCTITGAGTSPTVTYIGDLNEGAPS
jgi:hypothetical protein